MKYNKYDLVYLQVNLTCFTQIHKILSLLFYIYLCLCSFLFEVCLPWFWPNCPLSLSQLEALAHPFFDELREPNVRLPNGRPLPPLFNFKQEVCLFVDQSVIFFYNVFYDLNSQIWTTLLAHTLIWSNL